MLNLASISHVNPLVDRKVKYFHDYFQYFLLDNSKKIDGFAGDGLLLEGWLQKTANTDKFQVDSYAYSKEGVACMVPENNSKLLDKTNFALLSFMQGFVTSKPAATAIFDKWFGPNSVVPLNQDLRGLVKDNMQNILDMREELPDSAL